MMLVITFWILLKIISLFVYSVETAELIEHINTLIVVLINPLLLMLAVYHTNIPKWFRPKHSLLLFIVPAVIYVLVFTSPFHRILFYDFNIIVENNIPIHIFKKNYGIRINNIYGYTLILASFIILVKSLFSKNIQFRRRMVLFLIGLLIPIIYDALYLLGLSPLKNFNLAPVFLSIGNCFLAWSIIGYKLFKILPFARNLIIDNMPDIMIITYSNNIIIDINKSGELLFDLKKDNILNRSFYDVFKDYPALIKHYPKTSTENEISIVKSNQNYYYSVSISPFHSDEKQSLAYIVLLHDITDRIKAETQIKRLSTGIEQAPITVVITDLAGNIEYVNPAFCKFTRENGTVTINVTIKEPFVEIQIKDTGVGIPAENVPHLFSIEKNTSTKGTANESGTGLGLILCKELVETQGGKIWAESTEGEGSSFYFTLFQTKP